LRRNSEGNLGFLLFFIVIIVFSWSVASVVFLHDESLLLKMGEGGESMRQKSSKLIGVEAVLRRLPETEIEYNHFKEMYAYLKKGHEGEVLVDHMLREMHIPSPHSFFQNYESINHAGNSHQIDTLLLTPHFIWLLEIKNIRGRLDIDESKHQLIRTNFDGSIESFRNPVNQIKRHSEFLLRKLCEWGIRLPIESAVIIVNNSTIIGTAPKGIPFFHASGLQTELDKLLNKYPEHRISSGLFEKLRTELMNMFHRKEWKPKIDSSKFRKGVLCKICEYKNEMMFEHGCFVCLACGFKSKDAHLEALSDYRSLFNEWIANRELRDFLKIESRYAVIRLLKELNLETKGTYRNRKYKIPDFIEILKKE
jgi:hypothetical protein